MSQTETSDSITLYKSETEFLQFKPEDEIGFTIFYFLDNGKKLKGSVSLYQVGLPNDLRARMEMTLCHLKSQKLSLGANARVKVISIKASELTQKKLEKMLIDGDYAEKVFDKVVDYVN